MKDASAVISALGGTGAVAKALKIAQQVVCNWSGRNSIPWGYHNALLRLADERGVAITRSTLEGVVRKNIAGKRAA